MGTIVGGAQTWARSSQAQQPHIPALKGVDTETKAGLFLSGLTSTVNQKPDS